MNASGGCHRTLRNLSPAGHFKDIPLPVSFLCQPPPPGSPDEQNKRSQKRGAR